MILIAGLAFGQASAAAPIIAMGVVLTLANNILSYSFHAYQQELFPTGIRARAAGFVYSWSRLSVIFSSFVIAFVLDGFGAPGVFVFIAGAMAIVMAVIGIFGPPHDQPRAGDDRALRPEYTRCLKRGGLESPLAPFTGRGPG